MTSLSRETLVCRSVGLDGQHSLPALVWESCPSLPPGQTLARHGQTEVHLSIDLAAGLVLKTSIRQQSDIAQTQTDLLFPAAQRVGSVIKTPNRVGIRLK